MTQPKPKPKFEHRDRRQVHLGLIDLEALVAEDHPARGIWALLERVDFSAYEEEILSREGQAGRAAVPPRLLAALWIYGLSQGIGTARALERLQSQEPGLRWLCADDPVNYHTLADFRTRWGRQLEQLFSQVLAVLEQAGLVDLSAVVQDGTKVEAACSRASLHNRRTLEQSLEQAERVVRELSEDAAQGEAADRRRQAARERAARERLERMQEGLEQLRERESKGSRGEARVSTSDPEARRMKMPGGGWAPAYNVQLSTETRSSVVVAVEVSQAPADVQELPAAVERLRQQVGRLPQQLVADGGYASRENVEMAAAAGIELWAPWKPEAERQRPALARNGIDEAFGAQAFTHDADRDELICPAGQRLARRGRRRKHGVLTVLYEAPAEACAACPHRGQCCRSESPGRGRRVWRVEESAAMRDYQARMASPEARQWLRARSQHGEFPQLQIKGVMKQRRFHVRGLKRVRQEALLWALTHNVLQWVRRVWRQCVSPPAQPALAAC